MKSVPNSSQKPGNINPSKNSRLDNNKHIPEIRDNLDSREGEEQEFKGDDVTHNKKENKEHHLKQKNK